VHRELEKNPEIVKQEAVKLVNDVREIPFRMGMDGNPNKLVSEGYGNCVRKHLYLAPRLQNLGYQIAGIGIATFDWRKFNIPEEIISKLRDPIDSHTFLYLKNLEGKEILVDVTWNPEMPPGFPISSWDGEHSTAIGVTPLSITKENYDLFRNRVALFGVIRETRILVAGKKPTPFNDAFNKWIEDRKQN